MEDIRFAIVTIPLHRTVSEQQRLIGWK